MTTDMRKLMEAVQKINEFGNDPDPYSSERSVRQATNKLHELMDEQMLDPRAVADAALKYMSEKDVADMAHINELIYDEEDDFEESIEVVGEDMWPHDEKFPKKAPVLSGVDSEHMSDLLHGLAKDLAEEAIENAAGVWDEEGDGEGKFATGAQNQAQYVEIAARRYLTKEYKKTIVVELQRMFDEAVQREMRNYHENR